MMGLHWRHSPLRWAPEEAALCATGSINIRRHEHASLQTQIREALVSGHSRRTAGARRADPFDAARWPRVWACRATPSCSPIRACWTTAIWWPANARATTSPTRRWTAPLRASGCGRGWRQRRPRRRAGRGRPGKPASPSALPSRKTSPSRSTGRAMPIPSSTARSITISFRSPNGATAPARRSGRNGSAHGPTTPGPMTIRCSSSRSAGGILPRRGIMASDEEILITLGAQNALYLLTSLLVRQDTPVAMEEPGFPDVRNIFALLKTAIEFMALDAGGAAVSDKLRALRRRLRHAQPPVSDDRDHAARAAAWSCSKLASQPRLPDHRGRLRVRDQLCQRALPGAQVAR